MSDFDLRLPLASAAGGSPFVVETHVSVLVFLGDRVYKMRKPVHYGFVDFTDREERERDCYREVELNSRYAPDVYLGVLDLYDRGVPVDHLVVMRRLPEERRLASMVERDEPVREQLRAVVKLLVDLDTREPRQSAIDEAGTRAAVAQAWEENFAQVDEFVGAVLDAEAEAEIRLRARRYLAGRDALFERRITHGRIREGHGDLRAEDVFCLDDGPRILDCIEFDDRLRFCDVVADLAFLAMDLERLGRADLAQAVYADYAEYSNDSFPRSLVDHYCASRAYVRAKICCLSVSRSGSSAVEEAGAFQRLALRLLRRASVRMVLVGGLPGTGKTTLSEGLGAKFNMAVLHSDEIRREIAASADGSSVSTARYGEEETALTYATLLERARLALADGQSVVVDASWTDRRRRDAAGQLARELHADLVELRCEAPRALADRRVARRLAVGSDASEANVVVAHEMEARADPWPSATPVDTSSTKSSALRAASEAVNNA